MQVLVSDQIFKSMKGKREGGKRRHGLCDVQSVGAPDFVGFSTFEHFRLAVRAESLSLALNSSMLAT
jgi:hypothetical protein